MEDGILSLCSEAARPLGVVPVLEPTAVEFATTDATVDEVDKLDPVLVPGARFEPAPTADGLE